jgi:hypothetical protein
LLSLLLFPFLSGGFDAWAMLAILASTLLLADGHGSGWWVAAAGTLLKLSPGAAWTWARRPLRAAIAALGLTLAAGLAPLAIAHRSTDTYLGYSLHRGVQIESVAGSLAWMGAKAVGHHPAVRYRFRAWEIVGADRLALAIAVAAVVAVGLLVVRTGTAGEITVERAVRASLAAVVILTVGFKVFSPQYVTWTAPLACLIGGRELRVFAGAAALTAAAYVIGGSGLSFMGLIAGRNLAMVTLAVLALGPLVRTSPSGATAT